MAGTASRDLSFNVAAIDRAGKTFEKIALRLERLEAKLDKLDRKRVEVDVDVDTNRALRKIDDLGDVTTSATVGAVRVASSNIYIFIGLAVAALAALPLAGAIAASGLVLAVGGGLAAVGAIAAAQNKRVQKSFTSLKKHVVKESKQLAKPFRAALSSISGALRGAFDKLAPDLRKSFKILGPAVSGFVANFAKAFQEGIGPALAPLSQAFSDLLGQLGPMLGPFFASIGDSLTDIATTVSENREAFAGLIAVFAALIPVGFKFIAFLAKAWAWLFNLVVRIEQFKAAVAAGLADAIRAAAGVILGALGTIINGAAKAFGWIPGIGPKLKSAAAGFNTFKEKALDSLDRTAEKAREAKREIDSLPKIIKISGDIRDLETKLNRAKARLKDPTISKATRKRILGNIRQLENKIERAKALLASIRDRNVYVNVITRAKNAGGHPHATTYYPGKAHGGPVFSNRSYLVGERGPEILTLGQQGGNVTPNRKVSDGAMAGEFTGTLVLDSGEFLGKVHGAISERDRSTKRRATSRVGGS